MSTVTSAMPKRIKLSRARGWRLPPNARSVANTSRWKNPHRPSIRSPEANAEAVKLYEFDYLPTRLAAEPDFLVPLAGKDLACVCDLDLPCHADVLLRLANPVDPDGAP